MTTNGWDTVYAISTGCLNTDLGQKSAGFPNTVSYQQAGMPFTITAGLGAWQVTADANEGQFLTVNITIASGTLDDADKGQFPLAGMILSMRVALQLLAGSSLQFNIPTISAVEIQNPGSLSELQQTGLLDAVSSYLTANAASINYVLASIDPAGSAGPAWLRAQSCNYGTLPGYLVIVCDTQSANSGNQAVNIDPSITASGDPAVFLMSSDLFLENVVLPSLAPSFGIPASPAPFVFQAASHAIVNNGTVALAPIEKDGFTYHPTLAAYSLSVSGTSLAITAAVGCKTSLGADASFSFVATNAVQYDAATHTLTVVPDPKPVIHDSTKIPWYEFFYGVVLGIIVTVLVSGLSKAMEESLSQIHLSGLPAQSVAWTASGGLQVNSAGLNDQAVYLQGTWS
jgi:hypothetical protein